MSIFFIAFLGLYCTCSIVNAVTFPKKNKGLKQLKLQSKYQSHTVELEPTNITIGYINIFAFWQNFSERSSKCKMDVGTVAIILDNTRCLSFLIYANRFWKLFLYFGHYHYSSFMNTALWCIMTLSCFMNWNWRFIWQGQQLRKQENVH